MPHHELMIMTSALQWFEVW